jgi:hypothetical protein
MSNHSSHPETWCHTATISGQDPQKLAIEMAQFLQQSAPVKA